MESRMEEIMDSRLSSLPDDIIHKILSTLPMEDVIKTSVLSSRWRYIWTSMPCLNFSYYNFSISKFTVHPDQFPHEALLEFIEFFKNVLSHRNNQVPVSTVKLNIHGEVAHGDIDILVKYILSHNVQQVDVECVVWPVSRLEDIVPDSINADSGLPVTLFGSQSLKHLSLTMEDASSLYLTASSTLELPALTTLYLSCVKLYPDDNTLFSKCPNLKNLTLKSCKMKGLDSLSICHHQLSNLTLEHDIDSVKVVNVVASQLQNLTIRYRIKDFESYYSHHPTTFDRDCLRKYKHLISAPNLTFLIYEGYDTLPLSTDGFHSLEKVDLCIRDISQEAAEAFEIVRLFQQIRSVKFLRLNLEILELLSSHVQVISHHPPPFAKLKSLDIYPIILNTWETDPKEIVNISPEVKNYLLDSSQGATFKMFSRQEALADMKATQASVWMADLQMFLDTEKDIIETNRDHKHKPTESMYNDDDNRQPKTQMQLQIRKINKQIKSCWIDHEELSWLGNRIVNNIMSDLENIENILTELPASKRAMLQPCFSSLCAESMTFLSKLTERIKIHGSENLNNASDRLHELATALQSSS